LKHAADRKTIVFTPGVASAILFAETFLAAGVPATFVSGDLPIEDRRERLRGFSEGAFQVVTNAMVLTEGYDEPSVDCIMVARPTRSKPLYIQQIGRGTRLYPGKDNLLVLDLVGNEERLDLISIPKLFGIDPDKAADGVLEGIRKTKEEQLAYRQRMLELGRMRAGLDVIDTDAHDARLLDRKDINWIKLTNGEWALSGKRSTIFLRPQAGRNWEAFVRVHEDGRIIPVASGHDLAMTMGIAEEKVLRRARSDSLRLIDRSAPWRQQPATEKQLSLLANWRIPVNEGMLAGEASDLISARKATQPSRRAYR
jgi:ATP-dependent helicase IRC3